MRIRKKCVQVVIPKPAKLLKSLLQFGMSVKYVVFDFGRLCHFGIGITFLRLLLFFSFISFRILFTAQP